MKKILFTFFFINEVAFAFSQTNLAALVQKCKPSIFSIITYDAEGKALASGTGFFINSKGVGVTNYHVLAGASKATIETLKGQIYSINEIISESKNLDVIKFSINNSNNGVDTANAKKIYDAVSEHFNIGDYDTYIMKMGTPEGREKFYNAVSPHLNIGEHSAFEEKLKPKNNTAPIDKWEKYVVSTTTNNIFPFLVSSQKNPTEGENVFTIGNPEGLEYSVSNGIVSSIRNDKEIGKIIQTTTPISHGNSGSPLMNMKGEVIGIISFTLVEGQNLNFAVDISNLSLLSAVNSFTFPPKLIEEEIVSVPNFKIQEFQRFQFYNGDSYVKSNVNDPKDEFTQMAYDALSSHAPQFSSLCYKGKLCDIEAHVRYGFTNSILDIIDFSSGFRSGCSDDFAQYKLNNSCIEETLKEFFYLKNILTSLIGNPTVCVPCEVCSTKPIKVPNVYSDEFKNGLIKYAADYPEHNSTCLSWFQYTNNSEISLMYSIESGWVVWIKQKEH